MNAFPRFRADRRSLSTRLIVVLVVVVVATTVAAGVPAYLLTRAELEQQAWARVADGGRVTQALLAAEQARLVNMATLTAQRPTLQRLLQEGDTATLVSYLQAFQSSVGLDLLHVWDASGQPVAAAALSPPWPGPPTAQEAVFRAIPGSAPQVILLADRTVLDGDSGERLGYVTVGVFLDDEFARQLALQTGFAQSVVMDGSRIATSLEGTLPAVDAEAAARAQSAGRAETVLVTAAGARYYTLLLPLVDAQGQPVALSEVALAVDGVGLAEQRALLVLVLSTLLVAAVSSAVGGLYTRRLIVPLQQLTVAARCISQGDLTRPVPLPREPVEIATLAGALEEGRVNTRRALDDLSQAKAWSETLLQSIEEGIVTLDIEGRITFFSQGAERITGWPGEVVVGRSLSEVFRLPDGDEPFMIQTPPGGQRQVRVLTRDGRPVTLAVSGARLIPPNSNAVQVALVLRDITEEEAIQHLRSYFLANISHEFRTPLTALNASVEWLLEEFASLSPAEVGELLNSIHLSVTGLQTLIDNLLESISIEAGRFAVHRRPVELNEIVDEVVRVMQPLLNRRQQSLAVTVPDDLPLVNVDPTRLTQVLVNLLSNASKYSPIAEGIALQVERAAEGALRVAVLDRGAGIPPAEREALFRRFVRLDAQDGTQYGIGLGLSVVKAIVEEHGGKVGVDARPGGGSVFWFTLPLTGGVA